VTCDSSEVLFTQQRDSSSTLEPPVGLHYQGMASWQYTHQHLLVWLLCGCWEYPILGLAVCWQDLYFCARGPGGKTWTRESRAGHDRAPPLANPVCGVTSPRCWCPTYLWCPWAVVAVEGPVTEVW